MWAIGGHWYPTWEDPPVVPPRATGCTFPCPDNRGRWKPEWFPYPVPWQNRWCAGWFPAFPRQADDEVAVDGDADLLAVLREPAGHFSGGALLDVLQDLVVAGFEAHDKQARAAVGHGLQRFVVAVVPRRAGPAESQRLELL